jgi:hypothetical protein
MPGLPGTGPLPGDEQPAPDPGGSIADDIGSTLGKLTGWDAVKTAVGEVSDPAMWRSLGWLILGMICIFTGLALWLRLPQKAAHAAAAVASAAAREAAAA